MKLTTRIGLVLISAVALLAGVSYADPQFAREWGLDFWNEPDLRRALQDRAALSRQLTVAQQETLRRIDLRESIVADVIAGRIEARAAIDQFVELNRVNPNTLPMLRLSNPQADDRTIAGIQLLDYVKQRHDDDHEMLRVVEEQIRRGSPKATE